MWRRVPVNMKMWSYPTSRNALLSGHRYSGAMMHRPFRLLTITACAALVVLCAVPPAHAAGKTKKVTADATFLQLPALQVSIGGPYRYTGLMVLEFGLEIPNEVLRAKAEGLEPRLRDAHSQAMNQFAANYYKAGTVPNAAELANRLQRATDAVLGQKGARILLGSILVTK